MLFPSLPTAVQAEESGSTANLNVESAVAITLPDTVAIDVTPTPGRDVFFQQRKAFRFYE